MKIVDVITQTFQYKSGIVRDSEGHTHPGHEHDARQTLLRIVSDTGVEGYAFGADAAAIEQYVKPSLLGADPFFRERLWQNLRERQRLFPSLLDRVLSTVDCALWDLAGRALNLPVYQLLGAQRDAVKAYASTMCGDDLTNGLPTARAYAVSALRGKDPGPTALKRHTG